MKKPEFFLLGMTRNYTFLILLSSLFISSAGWSQAENAAFDLSKAAINSKEIVSGGPGKDGIPALTDPTFLTSDKADYLSAGDLVIGLDIAGDKRAYPIRILNWHEIINDTVGGRPLAVTYCPLTVSALVFQSGDRGLNPPIRCQRSSLPE